MKKLFVIDTDNDFKTQVKFLCSLEKVEVRFFSSCIESLPYIRIEELLLIFIDIEVPDVNDFVMYEVLKKTYDNSIPVLVTYTNQSEKKLIHYKKMKLQPKNYCKKPLSNDDIHSILQNHLELDSEEDDDILLLSEEVKVTAPPMVEVEGERTSISLSSALSEVQFYVNDGYFGEAEKVIEQLKLKYPGNKLLLAKIEKFKKAKMEALQKDDSGVQLDFEIEEDGAIEPKPVQKPHEDIDIEGPFDIEMNLGDKDAYPNSSDIKFSEDDFIDFDVPEAIIYDTEKIIEINEYLSEIDQHINKGDYEGAERLIKNLLREKYPGNPQLLKRIEIVDKARRREIIKNLEEKIGQKMTQLNSELIMDPNASSNGYAINDNYDIIGLRLKSLEISDISFLKDFNSLSNLNLLYNGISDISPLKDLTNLKNLSLSGNKISDITPLKNLKNLEELYLSNNKISDFSSIVNLKGLRRLTLINNELSQLPAEITDLEMEIKWDDDYKPGIVLSGNPLVRPPEKIIKQGREAVREYFKAHRNKEAIINEEWARECISKRQYADGKRYLLKAIDLNFELIQRFEEEFGFLYDLDNQTNDEEKTWKRKTGQIEWRRQVWQTLASRNKFGLTNIDEEYTDITPDDDELPDMKDEQADKTSGQKGKELEQAVMMLFKDFFKECKETCDIFPVKERRQKGGLQFGYDLEFICELKGSRKLKLLIECKNYTDKIKLEDIAGKLDAVKADSYFSDVDHWILISPRANATNELNRILKLWEKVGEYPFNVHLWTPETKVDNFFAVNLGIYDSFFKPPKGKVHPKDWDEKQKRENIEFWKRQLEPPLRLPNGWMDYLRNPLKLRLHGDSSELENLYQHHVALKCKDESGSELAQTLEEKVLEWLEQPVSTNPSIILLGEFGDGKTVFTYLLARKLTEKFLESPSTGWIPVRFSLKDFGLETVKNSRDFVRRRLEEFGADIDGWNTLKLKKYRILAILDGFDEISKKLDHKTVFRNINDLIECYKNEFFDVKLLITSRKHFFENQQDKERLIHRIGNPQLLHLSPIDRKTTEDHLNKYAREIDSEEKFKKLRNYHDPIGLASKPLYLEMVKASLKELPEENLNELILYETYTKKSLERKDELLEDEKLETPPIGVINNMMEILEEIAVRLHQSNEEYVYLSEFKGPLELRKRLWAMTVYDESTSEDETARIAVRSLLRRIKTNEEESGSKKWPVDFCHRSMREYFVAHGVCKMLKKNLKEARQFLNNHSLNHEIIFFASELMKKDDFEYQENLLNLIRTTKNLNNLEKLSIGYLGCNAVNLLYRYKGSLPGTDWTNLILNGANLSEADLSGKDFSNSSLQYANLDNVNFKNANFSSCNLTGVRLEETSEIESIGVSPGRNVYVSYSDGVIREWVYERVHTPYSKILYKDKKLRNIKLTALPGNDMTILVGQYLAFYDNVNNELERKSIFDIKSEVKLIKASPDALLLLEVKDSQNILHLVNLKEQEVIKSIGIPLSIHYDHLDDRAFMIYDEKTGIQLIDLSSKKRENLPIQLQKGEYITCLNTHRCRHLPGQYRLSVGQKNGAIQIWDINLDKWEASLLFKEKFHEKTIKDIAFIDEERIIFGGFDKKLSLISINQTGELKCDPLELKIAMQCQGMQVDSVVREEERSLLEKLIAKASS